MAKNPPEKNWVEVERFIAHHLIPADPSLESVAAANAAAGLPAIDVTPNEGKLLHLLARLSGAQRILEIGTLGGYSTIWLARALPEDGQLISLELEPKHAEIAQANLELAGLWRLVEIRVGRALDLLGEMAAEGAGPFDLIFIDADKANNAEYLRWALKFSREGTLIVVDNVVRDGAILDESDPDPDVQGSRQLFEAMAAEPRLVATALQTVGSKGWDGFAIALVTGENEGN
jgi:predicted O-methyltransferase YrrM